jgi:hypothetical protein
MSASSNRAGFVEFQQRLARMALDRGELGAARAALRVLRSSDFVGGATACETYFAPLREPRATEAEIRQAIAALVRLHPAGSSPVLSRRHD